MADYESCATRPDNLIHFQAGDFRADVYLDRLIDLPVTNIRKLFKLMLSEPCSNREAIEATTAYLDAAVHASNDAWGEASKEFVHGWRKVDNPKSRHPAVVEKLKNNKRLTRTVKAAKARYERWVKIQTIWANATR